MDYKRIQVAFFLGVLMLTLLLTIFIFLPYMYALVMAIALAVIFNPVYKRILKAFKKNKVAASLTTVFLVLLIILIPLTLLSIILVKETTDIYSQVANDFDTNVFIDGLQNSIQNIVPGVTLDPNTVDTFIKDSLDFIKNNIGSVVSNVASAFITFFLTLFALYYMFKDGKKLKKAIITFSPLADKYDRQILNKLVKAVNSVIKGSLLVALIQGILAGIGFLIFQVPNPVLFSSLTTVAALIPAIGPIIIILPLSGFLYFTGSPLLALGLFLWGALLVSMIDNILRPKLIERDVNIHPFFIFLSVIGGIGLFGALGFVIGPLVLSLLFALLDIYREEFKDYIK